MTTMSEQDGRNENGGDTLALRWADALELETDLKAFHSAHISGAAPGPAEALVPASRLALLCSRFDSVFPCEASTHEFWGALWTSDEDVSCPRLTRVVSVLLGHSVPIATAPDSRLTLLLVAHARERFAAQTAAGGIAFRYYQHKVGMGLWVSRPQWADSMLQVARGVCAGHFGGQARWAMRLIAANDDDTSMFIHGLDERGQQIFARPEDLERMCLTIYGDLVEPPSVDSPDTGFQLLRA